MKTRQDARHQLKRIGWTDEELDAIGLTIDDEGQGTMPTSLSLVDRYDRGAKALKMFRP